MIDPIEINVQLDCSAQHAFDVWTQRTSMWWPKSHSVSQDPCAEVIFEPLAGGRIYEQTSTGAQHHWGEIITWAPPAHLAYRWHLMFEPEAWTRVSITFTPCDDGTHMSIVHDNWERLGAVAPERRERNMGGWNGLLPHFTAACADVNHAGR